MNLKNAWKAWLLLHVDTFEVLIPLTLRLYLTWKYNYEWTRKHQFWKESLFFVNFGAESSLYNLWKPLKIYCLEIIVTALSNFFMPENENLLHRELRRHILFCSLCRFTMYKLGTLFNFWQVFSVLFEISE